MPPQEDLSVEVSSLPLSRKKEVLAVGGLPSWAKTFQGPWSVLALGGGRQAVVAASPLSTLGWTPGTCLETVKSYHRTCRRCQNAQRCCVHLKYLTDKPAS